jgi:hypothetical protein
VIVGRRWVSGEFGGEEMKTVFKKERKKKKEKKE